MHAVVLADAGRCIGCRACEIACCLAHAGCGEDPGRAGAQGAAFAPRLTVVRDGGLAVPVACRQCEAAPCAAACPTGAIASDGRAVTIEAAACTGCKACLAACPVGAMEMLPAQALPGRRLAAKCDLCAGRAAGPACLAVCPAGALFLYEPSTLAQLAAARRRRAAGVTEVIGRG
jgi:electron transport protein HydN